MLGLKNHHLQSQTTYPCSYFSDFHVIFMGVGSQTNYPPLVLFFPSASEVLGA